MDAHLLLHRITARDRGRTVLEDLSLALARGQTLALLGAAGAGKTALLLLLTGFLRPALGTVRLDGRDITAAPPHRRDIAAVFHEDTLFPHLSVLDNVAFGLKMRGMPRDERRRRAAAALDRCGLGDAARRHPSRLDAAERRRVALARACEVQPSLLIMDDPVAPEVAPWRPPGAAAILATRDCAVAFALADVVALLQGGRLLQLGRAAELYERPADRHVAAFTGACNLLPATLLGRAGALATLSLAGVRTRALAAETLPCGPVLLCIRPHRVRPDPNGPVRGTVEEIAYLGQLTRVTLRLPGGRFVAELPAPPPGLARGAALALGWDPDAAWAVAIAP